MGGSGTDGVKDDGHADGVGHLADGLHLSQPVIVEGAHVEDHRLGVLGHFPVLVRHHGRSAGLQRSVGSVVHDHVVGHVLYERPPCSHPLQCFCGLRYGIIISTRHDTHDTRRSVRTRAHMQRAFTT